MKKKKQLKINKIKLKSPNFKETIYLLSIPGMKQSIEKGLICPIEKCAKKLDW